jgi:hypothetical protein
MDFETESCCVLAQFSHQSGLKGVSAFRRENLRKKAMQASAPMTLSSGRASTSRWDSLHNASDRKPEMGLNENNLPLMLSSEFGHQKACRNYLLTSHRKSLIYIGSQ